MARLEWSLVNIVLLRRAGFCNASSDCSRKQSPSNAFSPMSFLNIAFWNSTAILHSFKAVKVHTHLCSTFLEKCCLKVYWCCSSSYTVAAATRILCLGSTCTPGPHLLCAVKEGERKASMPLATTQSEIYVGVCKSRWKRAGGSEGCMSCWSVTSLSLLMLAYM